MKHLFFTEKSSFIVIGQIWVTYINVTDIAVIPKLVYKQSLSSEHLVSAKLNIYSWSLIYHFLNVYV